MAERTQSAFAAAVGRLEQLTESELRQLYLIIGVRLGENPGGTAGPKGQRGARAGGSKAPPGAKAGKSGAASGPSSKGNPQRKSQWANHPLYQEYHRLKQAVEAQSKEKKLSFNAVDTDESRQYRIALSQWLEAKSSFRGRETTHDEQPAEEAETATAAGPVAGGQEPVAGAAGVPTGQVAGASNPVPDVPSGTENAAVQASPERREVDPLAPVEGPRRPTTAAAVGRQPLPSLGLGDWASEAQLQAGDEGWSPSVAGPTVSRPSASKAPSGSEPRSLSSASKRGRGNHRS